MQSRAWVLAILALILAPSAASAGPSRADDVVIVPPQPRHRDRSGDDVLYLNRCVGGCTVTRGGNSARFDSSSIPPRTSMLSEFQFTDEIWNAVVACVRDTYAPYDVQVVTDDPGDVDYVEVMVAGSPSEFDLDDTVLGIAPLASDCSAQTDVISFAFANVHNPSNPVLELCATVAHEAGHAYGLDHEFDCRDPMTYLTGCGQKLFLNLPTTCGEFDGPRNCKCGMVQNSHAKLTTVLGEGVLPPPP